MKISGYRFIVITILILLIPIYTNWKLLLSGEKTQGTVIKTTRESMGQLLSFYSVIQYKVGDRYYLLKGPENVEYSEGKTFTILYYPDNPRNSTIYSIRGIYFNSYTSVAMVLFILWVAFYLSFSPKSEKRKSQKERFQANGKFRQRKLSQ